MFPLEYTDWQVVCKKILYQLPYKKKYFLQWFPFIKLSNEDKKYIIGEDFFKRFIKSGLFLLFSETWFVCNNYMLKVDGNFRNASLVSPILYLVSLTIGKKISKYYKYNRPTDIILYYAGNYDKNIFSYEREYDAFCKKILNLSKNYMFFIKTDIKDFYSNIDVNRLIKILDDNININEVNILQKELMIYKELLLYIGQNEFPLIENSLVSSYLSTVIYLDNPDKNLYYYIKNKIHNITGFVMIRYVDDMYILFNSDISFEKIIPDIKRILYFYSSELKKIGLSLNKSKTKYNNITALSEELNKSFYGDKFNDNHINVMNLVNINMIINFINQIIISLNENELTNDRYINIINNIFNIENSGKKAKDIFNSLIYTNHQLFTNKFVIEKIKMLINIDYIFLKIDPQRLVIMLLKTRDSELIKLFLNKLFETHRKEIWDVYDTTIAVYYLIQRGFIHDDLLTILLKEENDIYKYYNLFCKNTFIDIYNDSKNIINIFYENYYYKNDIKLFILYFLFKIEYKKNNLLTAFAYYKSFFDRISAHFAYSIFSIKENKMPNYSKYYRESELKKIYSDIDNADEIIKNAHKLRNSNPIAHSSAELLDDNDVEINILNIIKELSMLIKTKIINNYKLKSKKDNRFLAYINKIKIKKENTK